MPFNTSKNKKRFDDIIKSKVRKDLGKLISSSKVFGQRGKDVISIPIPGISIPKFRHGAGEPHSGRGSGDGGEGDGSGYSGIGQGPGKIGQPIYGPVEPGDGEGGRKAGQGSTENIIETDITLEELAQIMQEQLELPNLEKRPNDQLIEHDRYKWSGLRKVGPDGLRRYRHSYFNALKRILPELRYMKNHSEEPISPRKMRAIPREEEWRFLSWKNTYEPLTSAVVMYMMDVSGSMSDEHKDIARRMSWWIDNWLRYQYKGLESIYIIHDYDAEEVDEETFYKVMRSGGTRFASAYDLANRIIDKKFPPQRWNIYLIHYTDGENWGDGSEEFSILENELMDKINMFSYAQIDYNWWSDSPWFGRWGTSSFDWEGPFLNQFKKFVSERGYQEKLRTTKLKTVDDIYPKGVKDLFGKTQKQVQRR